MGFNLSGPFELECWAKGNGTHNAPLFPAGEISLPWLGKYRILDLFVFGNEGPLVLVCSKALPGGFLFLVTHLMWLF